MSFADKIMMVRKEYNLSQEKMAESLGVSRQCVTKWESGASYPELDKLINLAQKYGVSLDWILEEEIGTLVVFGFGVVT